MLTVSDDFKFKSFVLAGVHLLSADNRCQFGPSSVPTGLS